MRTSLCLLLLAFVAGSLADAVPAAVAEARAKPEAKAHPIAWPYPVADADDGGGSGGGDLLGGLGSLLDIKAFVGIFVNLFKPMCGLLGGLPVLGSLLQGLPIMSMLCPSDGGGESGEESSSGEQS